MADADKDETTASRSAEASADLEGGSYEVIRARLVEQARELGRRAEALNVERKELFGGTELTVLGNERVRTENNCVPRDILQVGGQLLFGYNVYIGLKTETHVGDVFTVHRFDIGSEEGAFDVSAYPKDAPEASFLAEHGFIAEFGELYRFYKAPRLLKLSRNETKMLAVFQIGDRLDDIRVFRWALDPNGNATYIDNRGERDFQFPPQYDFEWVLATRDDQERGKFPHINVLDQVFVETTGGDLTIKVENNTETGEGIFSEPVAEPRQSLDDAEFHYAQVGTLILLKVLPYNEEQWRHVVFATRSQKAVRVDSIGAACVQLPEDHGIIFPGGYFLQDGQSKVFEGDFENYEFERRVASPNGEDVLFVFHHRNSGAYVLLAYNLIRKEVQNPIHCNGYSLFDDGRMVVFRSASEEPTRVHPMQFWQTPFVSAEHAAAQPDRGGPLGKIGNAELVRGISDSLSIRKGAADTEPSRQIYEDLIAAVTRALDSYHWLGQAAAGNLEEVLVEIRGTAELIIDEFDKVVAIRRQAQEALEGAEAEQITLMNQTRASGWEEVERFMGALAKLRARRGQLITLREVRYIDLARIERLEGEVVERFDELSGATIEFLRGEKALEPLVSRLNELLERIEKTDKTAELEPLQSDVAETGEGLTVLSEVVGGLEVDDPTIRTEILERISEVFGQLNRVRATVEARRKTLLGSEGRAEFAAQFKLFSQSVSQALSLADSPEKCDEQLSRLMVQLEELEARFSEFDEFLGELAAKREEVYEALGAKKQQLLDERQRRAQNLANAADRILQGVGRRARTFGEEDQLNAYFAADPMVLKLRDLSERLLELGDSTRADEIASRLKTAKQDALRGLRDKKELFDGGDDLIRFGKHQFTVNTQELELGMLPGRDGEMLVSLSGTDFREPIADSDFIASTRQYWDQHLVSETSEVYRGEYLAASILFAAERHEAGMSLVGLHEAERSEGGLLALVRGRAGERYDEGYERGLHDADATLILEKLLGVRESAGLLRFDAGARAWAAMFWAHYTDESRRDSWVRRALSFGRIRSNFGHSPAIDELGREIGDAIAEVLRQEGVAELDGSQSAVAGAYLVEELGREPVEFVTSEEAARLHGALVRHLDDLGLRAKLEEDLESLAGSLEHNYETAKAWVHSFVSGLPEQRRTAAVHAAPEVVGLLVAGRKLDHRTSSALTTVTVEGLLGNHGRIVDQRLEIRLDEFLARLRHFGEVRVPGYRKYREARTELLVSERKRLRVDEYLPRVLSSFVRNKLINDVYLPIVGDNLAKQLGAAGEAKRTDLMGLLLLISPPGYGKTTLMEYIANRLGLVFMKVNGPALGHSVHSLDPSEAPNATARQEVEKINLALEMGNNVMLYLDDIQHTHPELLQKFISLCDAQRRIEGVWNGVTRTYDLRGKKFCVVMAGNPYTESGDKFQIPDMLANRADTYNLGDILDGRDQVFALSYIENAITSNSVLAPLAQREQADIYKLVRMTQGEEVPTTDLAHGYSAVELGEIKAVFTRMFRVQEVLLAVNQEYIRSASMDDAFRTEPSFKLQGSYRNMNKLAEKLVAAMNERELEALIYDHYVGEAQTLTTGAEHNMLKLAELMGNLDEAQAKRWDEIKSEFRRRAKLGGAEDDPAVRVTNQLGELGEQLTGIRNALGMAIEGMTEQASAEAERHAQTIKADAHRHREQLQLQEKLVDARPPDTPKVFAPPAVGAPGSAGGPPAFGNGSEGGWLKQHLERLDGLMEVVRQPKVELQIMNQAPPGVEELLAQQVAIIERTLVPLVRTATRNLDDAQALHARLDQLIDMLKHMDTRMREGAKIGAPARAKPQGPAGPDSW